jgi:hypothetical protein
VVWRLVSDLILPSRRQLAAAVSPLWPRTDAGRARAVIRGM